MIKKNAIGDYVATCDECKMSDEYLFYDFREAQDFYRKQGWMLLEDGTIICPDCQRIHPEEKC